MNDSDRIPVALRVVRPAAKLETYLTTDPCQAGPESNTFVQRPRPQTPLERLQEIASLDLTDEDRNQFLTTYLSGLDEDALIQVAAVLSTLKDGEDLSVLNSTVWRKLKK